MGSDGVRRKLHAQEMGKTHRNFKKEKRGVSFSMEDEVKVYEKDVAVDAEELKAKEQEKERQVSTALYFRYTFFSTFLIENQIYLNFVQRAQKEKVKQAIKEQFKAVKLKKEEEARQLAKLELKMSQFHMGDVCLQLRGALKNCVHMVRGEDGMERIQVHKVSMWNEF